MPDEEYTVILRDQTFKLTRDQIETDSPNYFSNYFWTGFRECRTRELKLGRNPILFAFILEYLSGYEILPLAVDQLPPIMTPEAALKNLILDSLFYSLDNLHKRLTKAQIPIFLPNPEDSERIYIYFHLFDDHKAASNPCPISSALALKMTESYGIRHHTKWHLLDWATTSFLKEPGWQLAACWKEDHGCDGLTNVIVSIDPLSISKFISEDGITKGIMKNFPPWRDSTFPYSGLLTYPTQR